MQLCSYDSDGALGVMTPVLPLSNQSYVSPFTLRLLHVSVFKSPSKSSLQQVLSTATIIRLASLVSRAQVLLGSLRPMEDSQWQTMVCTKVAVNTLFVTVRPTTVWDSRVEWLLLYFAFEVCLCEQSELNAFRLSLDVNLHSRRIVTLCMFVVNAVFNSNCQWQVHE